MANNGRTPRIETRATEDEHTPEEAAATALDMGLNEFCRRADRESAEDVLAEQSQIVLGEAEAERFLAGLAHPEGFEAGMARLADRPSVIPNS